jgi:hypothetical protein
MPTVPDIALTALHVINRPWRPDHEKHFAAFVRTADFCVVSNRE